MARLNIFGFLKFILKNRNLVAELTKKEFLSKYLGSYLGMIWALVQPMVTIVILWFLFAIGFRTKPAGFDFPFILWLLSGMIPWFFINDSITSGTSSILDNSFLIKKVAFRVSILPLVRVFSVLVIHLIFIIILIILFYVYGYPLTIYSLQIFYYLIASIILVTGASLITASITVFIKDVRHMIGIFMQFSFWLTAVFWPVTILPVKYRFLVWINPFSYITEGFRDSLIFHQWFWKSHFEQTLYFWSLTLIIFTAGIILYKRLRPHFADFI